MGTRNLTLVYHKGKYRIAQYCQWDCHPEGQGATILKSLLEPGSIEALAAALDADTVVEAPDDEECRHFGARVLYTIVQAAENRQQVFVKSELEFLSDQVFCEWAWCVDLDGKCLEAYSNWDEYSNLQDSQLQSRFFEVVGEVGKCPCFGCEVWVWGVASEC